MNYIKISIIVTVLTGSFYGGWSYRDNTAKLDTAEFDKLVERYETELQQRVDIVSDDAQEQMTKTVETIKYVNKEVIKYVKDPDTKSCELDDGWVQLHEVAATGRMPNDAETAELSHDSTAAIEVIVENYGQCRAYIDQIEGLQNYIKSVIID
jgi:hypothetical protein